MRHILGMAKRHLDLRGAKGPKLELDFLRLVYAVQHLRRAGDEAQGYLLVMTTAIQRRTASWVTKYQAGDAVRVLVGDLTPDERKLVDEEVRANTEGMLAGVLAQNVSGRSSATAGGDIGERKLRTLIKEIEGVLSPIVDPARFPLGIRWDFYGVREGNG